MSFSKPEHGVLSSDSTISDDWNDLKLLEPFERFEWLERIELLERLNL
jgi:hypothetical protein